MGCFVSKALKEEKTGEPEGTVCASAEALQATASAEEKRQEQEKAAKAAAAAAAEEKRRQAAGGGGAKDTPQDTAEAKAAVEAKAKAEAEAKAASGKAAEKAAAEKAAAGAKVAILANITKYLLVRVLCVSGKWKASEGTPCSNVSQFSVRRAKSLAWFCQPRKPLCTSKGSD
jgi:hypothetical protein